MHIGNKELQIDRVVSRSEYMSGECFGRNAINASEGPSTTNLGTFAKKFVPLKPVAMNASRAIAAGPGSKKRGIELEPVNLMSGTQHSPASGPSQEKVLEQSWTANWYI